MRAGAITAQGSNGEHLAAKLFSHSPPFVSGLDGGVAVEGGGGSAERKGLKD